MKRILIKTSRKTSYNSIYLQTEKLSKALEKIFGISIKKIYNEDVDCYLEDKSSVMFWPYGSYIPLLFFKKSFKNVVFIFHNITPPKYFLCTEPLVALRAIMGYFQLFLLKFRKTKWIAVSEFNKNVLNKIGHRNVITCPNIVESSKVHCFEKFKTPTLLYVGRIVQNKDCIKLLNNVIDVARTFKSPINFIIVGNGKKKSKYFREFTLLLRQTEGTNLNVIWQENLPSSELNNLYNKSWLYITRSKHEGFGLPVCESIVNGTPALYTKCGGQEETLNSVGLVQGQHMVATILNMLNSPKELNILFLKQSEIVKQYQSPAIDEKVEKIYGRYINS